MIPGFKRLILVLGALTAIMSAGIAMVNHERSSPYRLNTFLLFSALLKTGILSAVFERGKALRFPEALMELAPHISFADGEFTYRVSKDRSHFFLQCPIGSGQGPLYAVASDEGIICSPHKIVPTLPFHIITTLRSDDFLEFPRSREKYLLREFGPFTVVGVKSIDGSTIHRHPVILNPSPFHEDLVRGAHLYYDYQFTREEINEIISQFNVTDPRVISDLRESSRSEPATRVKGPPIP